jgi:UDP-N-acetylglucosamine 2-epimerase (non-hydrolysing)
LDFLELVSNARVVVTDSGRVQEESSVIEVPCLTVRANTERPETIDAGVNERIEPEDVGRLNVVFGDDAVHESMRCHSNLYEDGMAGTRIVGTSSTSCEQSRGVITLSLADLRGRLERCSFASV